MIDQVMTLSIFFKTSFVTIEFELNLLESKD